MRRFLAAALAALGLAGIAPAATITQSFQFALGDFIDSAGAPAGGAISGTFTVTYADMGSYERTRGLTVTSLTGVTVGSALGFDFFSEPGAKQLYVGGIQNYASGIGGLTNDFILALDVSDPNAPSLLTCGSPYEDCGTVPASTFGSGYTTRAVDTLYLARAGSVTALGLASGVPEPASWALMVGGFGLVGGALRRRDPAFARA